MSRGLLNVLLLQQSRAYAFIKAGRCLLGQPLSVPIIASISVSKDLNAFLNLRILSVKERC